MKEWYRTWDPYKTLPYDGIEYTTCIEYEHVSRYRNLRGVVHCPTNPEDRFIGHETFNYFECNQDVIFYEVPLEKEHRLDLIAYETMGDATLSWIIALCNNITDGKSCYEGQILAIPKNGVYALFNPGELLQPVSPFNLNLGPQ